MLNGKIAGEICAVSDGATPRLKISCIGHLAMKSEPNAFFIPFQKAP
jgi:hypothetical protein